jgi:Mce-associated membrane protein
MARNRPLAGHRPRAQATPNAAGGSRAATTVLEPVAAETPPREPRTARVVGLGRLGSRLLAGLLALTVIALTTFGLVAYRVRADGRVESARDQAVAAAEKNAVTILSYDYRHLDADFAAAQRALTGTFANDYKVTTSKMVRPGAEQYHVVVKAEVAAESVVSASAGQVVVLLFVNQTTTSNRLDGPRVDLNRVRLTLTKVDGEWLVSKVVAL